MAGEDLGSAKLILTADDRDLSEKLRAAKKQVDELARQAGVTGDAFSKFFSRNYRLSINDSQLVAANTRLSNLQAKLKEIAASPINVRLNIIEGGLGGGGKQVTRETIQRRFQEATRGGLSGQLTDILAGGIGATRTADLRSTLLARLGRGSLGSGGFNVPGLREVITQLGGAPSGAREQLLKQARELVQNVNDSIINKVGQNLLDLKLQLQEGVEGTDPPGGDPRLRAEKAQTRLIALETRLNALQERGVDITRQRNQLARAQASLSEQDFRATALTTQQLENATRLEERAFRVQSAREQQARRSGVGGATTSEQILAGRGGQQKGAALSINAVNAALDKQLGLVNRINVLEAKGINVSASRAKLTQLQTEISNGNLGTANQLLGVLTRQVRTEENALRVANLRAAAAKKLAAAAAATPAAVPTAPPPRGGLTARQRRNREIASNALIGGAFPLLFGQGIGASLGGGLGGAAGGAIGGQFGFGLSLVGTAVGAQLDAGIQRLGALGKALDDPIKQFSTLQQNASLSSKELERYVEGLIAVGRSAEAAATIQQDLIETFGSLQAAQAYNSQIDELNRAWSRATTVLASFVVGPLADFLSSLTSTGTRVGTAARFEQLAQTLSPEQYFQVRDRTTVATLQAREARAAAQGGAAGLLTRFLPPSEGDVTAGRREGIKLAEQLLGVEQQRADAAARVAAAQVQTTAAFSDQFRLIDAQTQGYERQALIQEKQAVLNERNRKLLELPENRRTGSPEALKIQQDTALGVYRIDQQIAQLDKDRLATSTLQIAQFRLQSTELERQFQQAQSIAAIGTDAGVTVQRDNARFIGGLDEQIRQARQAEADIAAQISAKQLRGGDQAAQRIADLGRQQITAAQTTRNLIFEAATQLRDAGRSLKDNILNAQRSIRSTLEGSFDLLRAPIQQQLLEQARGRINVSLFDVGRIRTPGEIFGAAAASESIAAQQQIIAQSSTALVDVNTALVGVVQELNKKKWDVAVNVQGASGYQIIGDVVNATS